MNVLHEPCSSCPYLIEHPSGVWSREDYEKLRLYAERPDGQLPDALGVFLCHHSRLGFTEPAACRGWATVEADSIAMRIALASGEIDEADIESGPIARLFPTGNAAADNGLDDIDHPGPAAQVMIDVIRAKAERAGVEI